MEVIYEPKGKAREYAPLAANLYNGCPHGCLYCYVPSFTYRQKNEFHNKCKPRKNILTEIEKNAIKMHGDNRQILMSFSCDPYPVMENDYKITRQAISILNQHDLNVTILTKAGLRAERDFDILKSNKKNEFAVTLTTDNEKESLYWEPGAAMPYDRMEALYKAKNCGISTWVSFEPVINPDAVYRLIENTHQYVDFYKVGVLNNHIHKKKIDWPLFREKVVDVLNKYNKNYYLKKDLIIAK